MLSVNVTEGREIHCLKAFAPTVCTAFEKTILLSAEHSKKASCGISVKPLPNLLRNRGRLVFHSDGVRPARFVLKRQADTIYSAVFFPGNEQWRYAIDQDGLNQRFRLIVKEWDSAVN